MKALLQFTLSVLLILAMRSQAHAQCANDNVQWLSSTVTCGAPAQTLTSCIYGGEYRLVNGIVVGNTYVFSTCGNTSFDTQITLYNEAGGAALAYNDDFCGLQSQVTWVASFSGSVRVLVDQFNCQSNTTCMTLTASCTSGAPPPAVGCNNSNSFGSATINTSGTQVQISSCSYAGEYSTISGAVAGQTLQFTYSLSGGYITVRSGSPSGPVVAQGASPLSFNNTFTGTLYAHWNTSAACGSNSTCSVTTVQCTSCAAPPPMGPANDACANATPIACGGTASGSTTTATIDGPSGDCFGGSVAPDVWYTITGTGSNITASLCGSSYDTQIDVYTGSCGALTNIGGCNDDFCGIQSQMTWASTLGIVYRIRVHGFSGSTGAFTLAVTCAAPPCNAPGTPSASSITTNSAALSWAAAGGATSYRYSFGTAGHVCGTGSLTTAGTSLNLSGLAPNTTYTFCVRTDACGGGSAGSYVSTTFTTNPLPNDNCIGAINVSCGQTVTGSTVGATSDAAMGSCSLGSFGNPGSGTAVGGTPGAGVWYQLMGDGSQVTASLCNSGYDTKIHIYAGACGTLTCVASNDDNSAQCSPGSRSYVQFNTSPGTAYYILVSGFSSSTGNFSLQLGCVCGAPLNFPWTTSAVGGASGEAIDNVCGGSIDISSNGYSTANSDKMMLATQQVCGNASITVKVANITNQGYAGITMRENMAPGSRHASLSTQLTNRVFREARSVTNGATQKQQLFRPHHHWLRIVRTGNTFTYFSSSNGSQWGFVGTSTIAMPNCVELGMFTTGINVNSIATAVFTDLDMTGTQTPVLTNGNTGQLKAETPLNDELSVFPNPSAGELNLRLGQDWIGQPMEITIFNSVGKVVMNENIDQVNFDTHSLSLDHVASGVYFLHVRGQNGMSKTERIVINK